MLQLGNNYKLVNKIIMTLCKLTYPLVLSSLFTLPNCYTLGGYFDSYDDLDVEFEILVIGDYSGDLFEGSGDYGNDNSGDLFKLFRGPSEELNGGCQQALTSCNQTRGQEGRAITSADCYCDIACEFYRDCCSDYISIKHEVTEDNILFDCVMAYSQQEVEMKTIKAISSCPISWVEPAFSNANYCDSVSCPLVTSVNTNVTYRNSYYAFCHGVNSISISPQEYLICANVFIFDTFSPTIHECYDSTSVDVIRTCPSYENSSTSLSADEYSNVSLLCSNIYQNYVQGLFYAFKNEYCALCNGYDHTDTDVICISSDTMHTRIGLNGFQFLLSNDVTYEFIDLSITCSAGFVFDDLIGNCREEFQTNVDNFTASLNITVDCESTIALNDSEFEYAGDNMVLFRGELKEIQFNTSQGQPVICVNFTQNGTVSATRTIYIYPIGYDYITYVGCSLSIIGCCLVILTFCLFKDLRTLPTKILVNIAITIISSNILVIVIASGAGSIISLCEILAIFTHFFTLAQFMWMTVMCAEVAHTFYLASRLIKVDPKTNHRKFIIYFVLSWGTPLATVSICVVLNYFTDNLIKYGRNFNMGSNSCWINEFYSAVTVFLVPTVAATLLQSILFIVVCFFLFLSKKKKSSSSDGGARESKTPYLRLLFALYFSSNIMWLFAFFAVSIRADWAWYPFTVLQSLQGLVLFVVFFGTKKVFMLYVSKVFPSCAGKSSGSSSKTSNLKA